MMEQSFVSEIETSFDWDSSDEEKLDEEIGCGQIDVTKIPELNCTKCGINVVFWIMIFNTMGVNIDHGAIPAATKNIKEDLEINDTQLGFLGSLVFVGLAMGAVSASYFFGRISYQCILAFGFLGNMIGLLMFATMSNQYLLMLARFLSGFCQIYYTIYWQLYVDTYFMKDEKPVRMAILQGMAPLGTIAGYGITAFFLQYLRQSWTESFKIQAYAQLVLAVVILLVPSQYVNINEVHTLRIKYQEKNSKNDKDEQMMMEPAKVERAKEILIVNLDASYSSNIFHRSRTIGNLNESYVRKLSQIKKPHDPESEILTNLENSSYSRVLRKLMSNTPYVAMILSLTVLNFVLCNIQFWISDYMEIQVGIDKNTVIASFLVICITSPTTGVVLSAIIPGKLDNDSNIMMKFILISQFILIGVACCIPYLDNYYLIVISLWFFMCVGGCLMTMMLYLQLALVEPENRPMSNSLANFAYNILGWIPGPIVYGLVQTTWKGRSGMYVNFYYNIMAAVASLVAYVTMPDDLDNLYIKKRQEWQEKNRLPEEGKMPQMRYFRYIDRQIEHLPMGGYAPLALPTGNFEHIPGYVKQRTHKNKSIIKIGESGFEKDDNFQRM